MKKRYIWLIAAALLGLVLIRIAIEPSNKKTVAFAVRHQESLEDLITLCREEAARPFENGDLWYIEPDYSNFYSGSYGGTLVDRLDSQLEEIPVSPELSSAWRHIRRYGYFKRMTCSFDKNGALRIEFCTDGKWIPYAEGNYCRSYCLCWQDSNYTKWSLDEYWIPIGEADGIPESTDGSWYYIYQKHYDG